MYLNRDEMQTHMRCAGTFGSMVGGLAAVRGVPAVRGALQYLIGVPELWELLGSQGLLSLGKNTAALAKALESAPETVSKPCLDALLGLTTSIWGLALGDTHTTERAREIVRFSLTWWAEKDEPWEELLALNRFTNKVSKLTGGS